MSDTAPVVWTSVSDDIVFSQSDQVRVNLNLDCGIFSLLSKADISSAFAQLQSVGSVLDVQSMKPWYDPSIIASAVAVIVNPQQGVSAANLRNDAYTALSSLNSQKLIPCSGFTVGLIERSAPGSVFQPTPTQTISLVALAIIAVVVVFLIVQVKEAI